MQSAILLATTQPDGMKKSMTGTLHAAAGVLTGDEFAKSIR